ncbi:hypothetical protein Btru_073282, partial [Bulinus truncatus]
IVKSKNIYVHGANSRFINHDIIIGSAEDKDGKKLNISNPEVIHKTLESNCTDHENLPIITPSFIEGDAAGMFYHQFEYPKPLTPDLFEPCKEKCFPPNTFKKSGTVYVGLKPSYISYNLEDPYAFGVTTSACFSWNETIKDWVTNQCRLEKENGNVICRCQDGYQLISAVSFNFQPNSIHFGTVFSKFDIKAQGIVFGVLLSLYLIFAILCFWAHYMDKKGIFQWGVFPLVDNYAYESYFYLITVHTGLRKSAGTKSNVFFCLFGQDDETGGFPTGSVCHFVMACPKCLGDLQCLKIWHDNSGKGNEAPWFLDRIEIVDIQTRKAYYFICEEWLAAEYTLETTIEATSVNELEKIKSLFLSNTKQHLTDDHIWLSIFIRPDNSRFSRVERTACCLAFLLLAMITSAMFYTGVPDANRKQPKVDFEIGPIRIGFQQLYYSFLSAVITALPMMIIVTLFRKARTKRHPSTGLCKNKIREYEADEDNGGSEELQKTWPQAFRYIAWIIIAIAVVASSFFVILYSMEWGKDITEQWLTTFFLAFLQSLFVLDPFKVIVISVCLAILVKKVKLKGLDELDLSLIVQVNEEYGLKQRQDHSEMQLLQSAPLSKLALQTATLRRKIHIMIKNTLQEFLIHCVYLLIVSSLCYSNRSTNAFRMYKVINDQLVSDTSTGFLKINSSEQYYDWISNILTPWLLPDLSKGKRNNSNLDKIFNTEVQDIYLMGAARIRQLRIQKENCILYGAVLKDCVPSYRSGLEDTNNYCLGWGPRPCSKFEELNSVSSAAWLYKSAQDVWGLPIAGTYSIYGGGGYIVYLNINSKVANTILKELKEKLWIDQKTRAVFHEFTVYCPNINYFAFVILLAEFTETGEIIPFVNIYPYTVHNPPGLLGTYVQLCQVTGIVLTLLGIMYVVFIFGKKKWTAFKDIWFLLDFSAVIIATCGVAMFLLRLSYTKSALNKLKENINNYINFYHIVVWDSSYTLCLAMLVAIGYLRLLRLASYSEKTMKVYSVLSKAVRIFPGYFFFVFLILLGFIGMGYAFFGCTSYYFKDVLTTSESLFTGLLGRSSFRDTNVPYLDRWTTILYFCLFVGIVVIFLTNYFLAVLMDLLIANEKSSMDEESTKIFVVLWDSFLKLIGRKSDPIDRMKDAVEDDANRKQPKVDFEIGPIRIGYQQLYYSFLSAVITALPMLIIVTLFRKARTKRDPSTGLCKNKIREYEADEDNEEISKTRDELNKTKIDKKQFQCTLPWMVKLEQQLKILNKILLVKPSSEELQKTWPQAFRYIAWIIIAIAVVARQDHSEMQALQSAPLSKLALQTATLRRKIHIMIKNTLQEFLIHCVYLLIVSSLCCSNRSTNAFRIYKVINDQLVSDTSTGFLKINSSEQYYDWISNILTPWLLPDLSKGKRNNSNLDKIFNTEVQDIYLMGAARIRQLRIQKENCILYGAVLKDCVPSYRSGLEDTNNYCLGWGPRPCSKFEELNSVSSAAWLYKSAQDVWGLPIAGTYSIYGGGGYIVYLNINSKVANTILKELKEKLWIDQKTRAVFHEFTVYCPNINYFAFVILLAEFTETGEIIPFVNIYPYTVHNPPGLLGTYVQLCQVTGIVLTLLGIMYVVFIFGKKKWTAFKDIWFLLDFSAVIIATCGVAMFLLRLSYTKSALNKLKENINNYINFYHIVVWDSSYTLCLAMLVAIGYLRLLRLASYSEKTMKVYSVLSKAVRIFPGYFFFVFLILLGFIGMGYALFGCTSYYFKDVLTTSESLFTGLLGRSSFRDTNVPYSDRWTTILYFCLFVGIVVIFLTNYFLAVLMDLLIANEKSYMDEESTKIFIVLWDSFLKLIGRKSDPIDRMKDAVEDDTSNTEQDCAPDDDIIIKLEKNFYRLVDKLDNDVCTLSSAMEKKRRMH